MLIDFDIDDEGRIHNVQYLGGCNGNLQGIGRLVEGMDCREVRDKRKASDADTKTPAAPTNWHTP